MLRSARAIAGTLPARPRRSCDARTVARLGPGASAVKKPDAHYARRQAVSGAVTLIQRFGSAANLNIHLRCLVLDGVYRRGIDGTPEFVEVPEPTDEALQSVLDKIITRMTQAAHPSGGVGRGGGFDLHG